MISVKDNGIGMEVERINQLLYQRVESVSGTGLGLYNVHQRLLGRFGEESRLHIESEVGKGTLIWFLVPIG